MAFFEDLSRKVQDVAFAAAERAGRSPLSPARRRRTPPTPSRPTSPSPASSAPLRRTTAPSASGMFPSSRARLPRRSPTSSPPSAPARRRSPRCRARMRPSRPNVPTSPRPLPPKRRSRRPLKRPPRLPFRSKRTAHKKNAAAQQPRSFFLCLLREEALEDGILRLLGGQAEGLELEELVAGDLADGGLVNELGVRGVRRDLGNGADLRASHDDGVALHMTGSTSRCRPCGDRRAGWTRPARRNGK